ncbi:DUF2474 family protein [Sphingomonas rhizophila]|uniref:DUF2474 family protein n=1 Tax=Sphingomonas rhizophila TaxID=2071607 RepID=A0A7G9SE73_9SPHN|nr:DUF2474 family protein [Sphingomonas rhizophila]
MREPSGHVPLRSRLGWLLLIWGLSIAALGAVAMLLRWWLR